MMGFTLFNPSCALLVASERLSASLYVRIKPRCLDHGEAFGAVGRQLLGELVGRVEDRREPAVDQKFLLEVGLGADRSDDLVKFFDDRLRRAGRRIDAEEGRGDMLAVTGFLEGR